MTASVYRGPIDRLLPPVRSILVLRQEDFLKELVSELWWYKQGGTFFWLFDLTTA